MKPPFQRLWQHFPRTESRAELYETLGWEDIIDHKAYRDTCAIRMSYALLRADVALPGATMLVKAGPAKGRHIEHRQAALSRILKRRWGAPEVFRNPDAQEGIAGRKGVVSFFKIQGGNGGHIDLVEAGAHGFAACARSCYFSAAVVWFWALG
ncbi:T6SS effector amidase Tae4 family protein [Pseudoduganella plicata]|nr:T6SS effector amidase Tae4 family protein [Pseudoduganella plicata]GGY85984.1 hypothetical protein GCM10007388_18850 [Pseudoduganella plicata]